MSRYINQDLNQVEFICDRCKAKGTVLDTNDENKAEEIISKNGEWIQADGGDFCCRECFNLFIRNKYIPRREI